MTNLLKEPCSWFANLARLEVTTACKLNMRPEMKDYSLDAPQYTNPNLTQPAKYTPLMKCRGGKPRKNLNKYYSSVWNKFLHTKSVFTSFLSLINDLKPRLTSDEHKRPRRNTSFLKENSPLPWNVEIHVFALLVLHVDRYRSAISSRNDSVKFTSREKTRDGTEQEPTEDNWDSRRPPLSTRS
jgi:hypothetical protein